MLHTGKAFKYNTVESPPYESSKVVLSKWFWFDFCGTLRSLCGIFYQKGNLFHQTNPFSQHGPIRHSLVTLRWHNSPINSEKAADDNNPVLLVTHRWFLYLVFVFLLGAICTREALRYDFLIAEKVNSTRCFHPALLEGPSPQKGWGEGIPRDGSLCWWWCG